MENSINNFEIRVNTSYVGACGVEVLLRNMKLPKILEIAPITDKNKITLTFYADEIKCVCANNEFVVDDNTIKQISELYDE